MLVLSRKRGEKVRINDNVIITVVEIRGDKIRLGFEAPQEIQINREEVYQARRQEAATNHDAKG